MDWYSRWVVFSDCHRGSDSFVPLLMQSGVVPSYFIFLLSHQLQSHRTKFFFDFLLIVSHTLYYNFYNWIAFIRFNSTTLRYWFIWMCVWYMESMMANSFFSMKFHLTSFQLLLALNFSSGCTLANKIIFRTTNRNSICVFIDFIISASTTSTLIFSF